MLSGTSVTKSSPIHAIFKTKCAQLANQCSFQPRYLPLSVGWPHSVERTSHLCAQASTPGRVTPWQPKKRSWTPSGCPPSLLSLLLSTNRRRGTVTHTHTRTQSTTAADLRSFSAPASLIEHVHANDVTSTDDAYYFAKFRPVSQKCFNWYISEV